MSRLIASSASQPIGPGSRVRLHFSLLLETGEEVDTTRRGKPASFVMGDGNLLPGFEEALMGLKAGDDLQIELEPAAAFGERNPDSVQILETRAFGDIALEPGLIVSFASPEGELPGVVLELTGDRVKVDFNHPLAGRRITFDVSILGVEA
ncbi:MAG: peptidylprolyl isomerase [Gammaproteobacteria bacterium]|nr:peptidylprolyl isomerase [Gammaproteobacteria bacterium]|tara:strand:+ start:687 stop:1139 length:453 start_codon:yes stop_codon:yes gene_type:complete